MTTSSGKKKFLGLGGQGHRGLRMAFFFFEGDPAFMFFCSIVFSFSLFSEKIVFPSNCISLPASVSEFNSRCFLRGRSSMEMWCPDDIGREELGLSGGNYRGESMIPPLQSVVEASPDWIIFVVWLVWCVVVDDAVNCVTSCAM